MFHDFPNIEEIVLGGVEHFFQLDITMNEFSVICKCMLLVLIKINA
jgi:hypothetical protein